MRSALLIWGLLFLLWCGLSACSKGTINGKVFLDENNNGVIDSTEIGAPFAKILVFKDKNLVTKGITRQDGTFSLTSRSGGTYIFQLDLVDSDIDQFRRWADWGAMEIPSTEPITAGDLDDERGFAFKATESEPTQGNAQSPGTQGAGQQPSSAPASGQPQSNPGGSQPQNNPAQDDDDDADQPSGGSKAGGGSDDECGSDGWTPEGFSICLKRGESKSAQIGIRIDNAGALDQVADSPKKTCVIGTSCKVSITHISSCSVDVPFFDRAVIAPGVAFDPSLGVATIEAKITPHATSAPLAMGFKASQGGTPSLQPSLSVQELAFTAPADLKSFDFTMSPIMWCNGTRYELKKRQISFIRDIVPELHLTIVSTQGDAIKVKATLVSKGSSPIDDGTVAILFNTDNKPVSVTNAGGCDNLGQGVVCTVEQGEKSWTITTAKPVQAEDDTTITISAKYTSPHLENPIEAPVPATFFREGEPLDDD